MRLFDPVLYPLSLLYEGITRLRNRMFDLDMKKSVRFEVPVLVVGNLAIGGTGKTPMVEFLITHLKERYQIAALSRGYGRKTSGFYLAEAGMSPKEVGDEPFQIFQKFGAEITVAVGEQRILAIPQILADRPETNLIILDDAFQHRYVKGDLNILLTTFQKPFFGDRILPLGTLREHPSGARRADVVVVTKCPFTVSDAVKREYERGIRKFAGEDCPVLFSGIKYGEPYAVLKNGDQVDSSVILLSGIADNQVLEAAVRDRYNLLETMEFPDHHKYGEKDLLRVQSVYSKHKEKKPAILTTEKDAVKLKDDNLLKYLEGIPIFALPIAVDLNEQSKDFLLALASRAISTKKYSSES